MKKIIISFLVISAILSFVSSNASAVSATESSLMPLTLRLTSPNGGESWQRGTMQTIKWKDNTDYPPCPVGAYCAMNSNSIIAKIYDIRLIPYFPPCITGDCPAYVIRPYTIAQNVSGTFYQWNVGSIMDLYDEPVPNGQYVIQICQLGNNICDSSDSYFKIYSQPYNNRPPVINGITAPTRLNVNQIGTWTINAYDPENRPLSYYVNWGDAVPTINAGESLKKLSIQTTTFTHSYSHPGNYTITFTVKDDSGQTVTSSTTVHISPTKNQQTIDKLEKIKAELLLRIKEIENMIAQLLSSGQ